MTKIITIDEYILTFPKATQDVLQEVRKAIIAEVPEAKEVMSYGIPTLKFMNKNLLHFGAYSDHVGLYATPDGHAEFEAELEQYKRGKGSVQFPLSEPIPLDLIRRIACYRADTLKADR